MKEIERALEIVAENPQDHQAYYVLARVLVEQQKWEEAIAAYQTSTELKSDFWEAYHHWGDTLINLERWDEAVRVYQKAIAINPEFHWSYNNLGVALFRAGNKSAAIENYRQALELDENNSESYYRLGQVLASQEEWLEAITSYEQAASLKQDNWQVYHEWGDALINLEQWDEAVGVYQKAIAFNGHFAWTHHNLGLALLRLELCSEAIPFFRQALEINPNLGIAHYNLGEAFSCLQQWDQAIAFYEKTNKLCGNFPNLKSKLARALQQRVEADQIKALEYYQQALDSTEEQAPVYLGMAQLLAKQERFSEALYCCHQARQLQPQDRLIESLFEQLCAKISKFYEPLLNFAIADYSYSLWRGYNSPDTADLRQMFGRLVELARQPIINLILLLEDGSAGLEDTLKSLLTQIYPYWQLCIVVINNGEEEPEARISKYPALKDSRITLQYCQADSDLASCANLALKLGKGEFVVSLKPGVILSPEALAEVILRLNQNPAADLIYADDDQINQQKMLGAPWFKPDWCPDLLLCRNYLGSFVVCRRSLIETIEGFRNGYGKAYDYELILRISEQTDQIEHIPRILSHRPVFRRDQLNSSESETVKAIADTIQRRGEPGVVTTNLQFPELHTIRYQLKERSLVSIIIPTKNLGDLLNKCLESIFNTSTYPNYEVLVIDNGSDEADSLRAIANWQERQPDKLRSLRLEEPFNYSRLNNYAVEQSQGEYLLFLNNDTKVITADWIEAMLEQAQRPSIGAVGALLLYPDDLVQHAGVILGVTGIAGHSHRHFPVSDSGYNHLIRSTSNYAAVTAACMMCRREVFQQVGGFETQLAVAYNDVDFCLKLRQRGYQNIFLPHVSLYHYESQSRNQEDTPQKQARVQQEVEYMQKKWSDLIARDPFYSINLTREQEDYSLDLRPQAEVVAIFLAQTQSEQVLGCFIDEPKPGRLRGDSLDIRGWVIGNDDNSAIAVEIVCNHKAIAKTEIKLNRPDVAAAYPQLDAAQNSGFFISLKLDNLPHDAELNLQVVLADKTSVKLAKVLLRY
jgi:O-antigen biosynthesis protein